MGTMLENKLDTLEKQLGENDRLAIMASGGVDSTFLICCAKKVFAEKHKISDLKAVTVNAPNFDPDEISYAKGLCSALGVRHLVIDLGEEHLDCFRNNPDNRCYLCKTNIAAAIQRELPGWTIADGTNADDMSDYRPGYQALLEHGIISPLKDAGMTKGDIRQGLKASSIGIWNKPAFSCLATRIPTGEKVTAEKLRQIYQSEKVLRDMGFTQMRIRHHGDTARIEVPPEERCRFFSEDVMDKVSAGIRGAGFRYVALDLDGYSKGNMNSPDKP